MAMLALYDSCSTFFFFLFFYEPRLLHLLNTILPFSGSLWVTHNSNTIKISTRIPTPLLYHLQFTIKKRTWKPKLPGTDSESGLPNMSKQISKGNKLLSKAKFFISWNSISAQKKHTVQCSCLVNEKNLDFYLVPFITIS